MNTLSHVTLLLSFMATVLFSETVDVQWNLGDPPARVQFEPFHTIGGTRNLERVTLGFTGIVEMEVQVQNFSVLELDANDWYYEAAANVIVAFDQKEGYEDGGPFWGLGGAFIQNITGRLSAGSGGPPFANPTAGEVDVAATVSSDIDSMVTSDAELDYYQTNGPIEGSTQPFLDFLLTPPLDGPDAYISGTAIELSQVGSLSLTYEYSSIFPCMEEQLSELPGDLNGSGGVDFTDFLQFAQNFGGSGNVMDGDLNCDGFVTFPDFLMFSDYFARNDELIQELHANQGAMLVASVPEPGTSSFVAILVIIGFLRRYT